MYKFFSPSFSLLFSPSFSLLFLIYILGPSQFVSGIPEPSFVIFKFMLRRELVPCKVDQKILNYLVDSFASSLQVCYLLLFALSNLKYLLLITSSPLLSPLTDKKQMANSDNDQLSFWMSNIAFLVYMAAKEIKIDPNHMVTFAADVVSFYERRE